MSQWYAARNSNGIRTPSCGMCTEGQLSVVIPIFNTTTATDQLEWMTVHCKLADGPDGDVDYYPGKCVDDLNSAAGFTSGSTYPPNVSVLNLSTRSLNTLLSPFMVGMLSYEKYQFLGDMNITYTPKNGTDNCGPPEFFCDVHAFCSSILPLI